MASITKRGKKYAVVYTYETQTGEKKQKWETFSTHKEASKRKSEVEYQLNSGLFVPPKELKVSELLKDFVTLYGEKKWGVSFYASSTALITNYILPLLGDMEVQAVTPKVADKFVHTLQNTKPVAYRNREPTSEFLTPANIDKIIKLIRCAFRQAVRWDIIVRNPFDNVVLPKMEKVVRAIWDVETICRALQACRDPKLYVAINLAFASSLRIGEILGLTWDCVHINDDDIARDDAHILVEKELTRATKEAMDVLNNKDVLFVFPSIMQGKTTTRLVLKKPKTDSSIRKIWLPKTLAYILREWKQSQENLKEFLGEDYIDYNLVVALPNGRPCENRILENAFLRLKRDAGLPNVVFHSLRHSSTTYKLKLNNGNIKATQGDTGHAQADMVTEVYAHILDEDRKIGAQKFEAAFYANPDLRQVAPPNRVQEPQQGVDLRDVATYLMEQIKHDPELAKQLAAILAVHA